MASESPGARSVGPVAPGGARTIAEMVDARAESSGDVPLLECEGEIVTYAQMSERSARLAGSLRGLGLAAGDRVAMLSANSTSVIEMYLACARLGIIVVPLNIFLRGDFLRFQIEDSGAVAALVDPPGLSAVRDLGPGLALRHLIVVGQAHPDLGTIPYQDLIDAAPGRFSSDTALGDTAAIMYTSGTTGMAKGCMLPHGQFVHLAQPFLDAGHYRTGDRVISPSPMFHVGFLGAMFAPVVACGATVLSLREFRASTFMQQARDGAATVIFGVGAIGTLLLAQPESPGDAGPGNPRHALLTPMSSQSQVDFELRFGVAVNSSSYGQTECTAITLSTLGDPVDRAASGRPVDALDVRIVDDADRPVPAGKAGEVVIRPKVSDVMFSGYWNAGDATRLAWRNLWHHTGDIGRWTPSGELVVIDRKKDSIRRRGENVSSMEIEGVVRRHPSVELVAAHAVPSDLGEDDIKVCLVLRPGESVTAEELFEFFKTSLPYFAVPRYVEILPEFPTNAVGKVLKHVLRDRGATADTWDFEALGFSITRRDRRSTP